jgi:hypothetical protein
LTTGGRRANQRRNKAPFGRNPGQMVPKVSLSCLYNRFELARGAGNLPS